MQPLIAQEPIPYKHDFALSIHWFPYGLVLLVLCVVLAILAKKSKHKTSGSPQCRVVESLSLNHKTKMYVLDYQGQHFLIADNQHGLAIHPLKEDRQK
jgi:hypothetical protein